MAGTSLGKKSGRHTASRSLLAANRFAAAIVGGYAFAYGYTALTTLAGFSLGLPLFDAQSFAWMTGALIYLGAILWAFVPRRTAWAWAVLGGGGVAMGAAAWALSRWTM